MYSFERGNLSLVLSEIPFTVKDLFGSHEKPLNIILENITFFNIVQGLRQHKSKILGLDIFWWFQRSLEYKFSIWGHYSRKVQICVYLFGPIQIYPCPWKKGRYFHVWRSWGHYSHPRMMFLDSERIPQVTPMSIKIFWKGTLKGGK